MSRFPFPVPLGWYQLAWSDELSPGDVWPLYYFGQFLICTGVIGELRSRAFR